MKILRVIARMNVGGPARHVLLLDRGLQSKGWDTLLVHGAVGPGEASLEHLTGDGFHVRRFQELGPRLGLVSDAKAFWSLLRLIFATRPDVIHTHTAKAGALGRTAAALFNATRPRRRRALVVHTFHGHVFEGYFGRAANLLVRSAERVLASVTDRIVTISARQREDIVRRFAIAPESRVVMIPLGLDLTDLLNSRDSTVVRDALGIPRNDFVAGYVGRFVAIKDLPTLVTAFAALRREHAASWLILAGDGPVRGDVEARARALGIIDRVKCLGWIEDLPALYAALDVCVLSSLNEGTPVAAIEAMAAGKLVVATAVGGVPDVLDDGRTGVLVPPRDPDALARALIDAANDPGRRRTIGLAARSDAADRFSSTRLVDDIDHLYRDALSEKRGTIVPAE